MPVNARAKTGWTALHVAAIVGRPAAVKCLLECGANVNARSDKQETPLHFAALYGRVKEVELLIAAKADLEAADEMGDTPLQLAAAWNHERVVNVLLKAGAKMRDRGFQERAHTCVMEDVSNLLLHLKLDVGEEQ
ncbi:serine/threonine-protein kinase TNNI3K-like [Schistocerca nitens]|uniref:serine/threonine-protein kinase TNNI3K-like n=1 Tax=Schistocerca nitens TaxID=7011 RepID=UPI00211943F7|nr:serine/threonine-protein kinase TNNI3K-like [Schistocerca nitens]